MKKSIFFTLSLMFMTTVSTSSLRAENIGVPAECEDVMLQTFYWQSCFTDQSTYGRTQWLDLLKDTTTISDHFDLVWFPPSAWAGAEGGVGYYHKQLSNQTSVWGSKDNLVKLINALHRGHTKVLGDIVINHRGNYSNWCDFHEDDFGSYGKFQLTSKHICKEDEGFTVSGSTCYGASINDRGAADTGSNDDGCRDLDHTSGYVQTWAKAYVQWMKDVMKYDGFRYDMTLGYHGQYLSLYNEAAKPYFSVSECWADISREVQHLQETNYNTLVFDFPQKYLLNEGIGNGDYRLLVKNASSFRGQGLERYAVTFVDNHDTFERNGYGDNQFGGQYCNLSDATIKNKILQANAYILTMPGVPCVFWPHWSRYRDEINALIAVRKLAGIHSESAVSNESASNNAYEATVRGHKRNVIVRLGTNRSKVVPTGYELALEGGKNGDYTLFISEEEQEEGVHNYSVVLYAPDACPEMKPAIIGDFNKWAEGVPMKEGKDQKGNVCYTYSFRDKEGNGFKFKEVNDTDWSNEILWNDYLNNVWNRPGNFILDEKEEIVVDLSNNRLYSYNKCGSIVYSVIVNLKTPAGTPESVEIIGTFDDWSGTPMQYKDGVWSTQLAILADDEFKIRAAGTWGIQIEVFVNEAWQNRENTPFANLCEAGSGDLEGYLVINLDLTDAEKYRWTPIYGDDLVWNEEKSTMYIHGLNGSYLYDYPLEFYLPEPPVFADFTFKGWKVAENALEEGIHIHAIYEPNKIVTSAPAVVVNPLNPSQKLIRDGNVYILHDEETYSITGKKVN